MCKVVAYGMVSESDNCMMYHFLSDGRVLYHDEYMPQGEYSIYTGGPQLLDHLHVIDQDLFVKYFQAWDD